MADIGYDGQVAIITGSGGGLGREHALELARRGARIVVNDLGGSVSGEGHEEGPAHKTAQDKGSATAQFVPKLFKTLGIDVQEFYMSQGDALENSDMAR